MTSFWWKHENCFPSRSLLNVTQSCIGGLLTEPDHLSEVEIVTEDVISGHSPVPWLHVEDPGPWFLVVAVMILAGAWLTLLWRVAREGGSWHWQSWWWAGGGAGRWWGQAGGQQRLGALLAVVVVVEFDEGFVKRRDQFDLETVLRVPDHLDHVRMTAPLDIILSNTNQVVSFPHTTNLQWQNSWASMIRMESV